MGGEHSWSLLPLPRQLQGRSLDQHSLYSGMVTGSEARRPWTEGPGEGAGQEDRVGLSGFCLPPTSLREYSALSSPLSSELCCYYKEELPLLLYLFIYSLLFMGAQILIQLFELQSVSISSSFSCCCLASEFL